VFQSEVSQEVTSQSSVAFGVDISTLFPNFWGPTFFKPINRYDTIPNGPYLHCKFECKLRILTIFLTNISAELYIILKS